MTYQYKKQKIINLSFTFELLQKILICLYQAVVLLKDTLKLFQKFLICFSCSYKNVIVTIKIGKLQSAKSLEKNQYLPTRGF